MAISTILKFKLKNNYRDPISIGATDSVFQGRTSSLSRLRHIFEYRKAATVLLGGARGIGKTSFVRETLRQIEQDEFVVTKPLVIESSIATIGGEGEPDEHDIRKKVLNVLIRSLYFRLVSLAWYGISLELKEKIEILYEKTYYKEETATKLRELQASNIVKASTSSSEEKIYKVDFSPVAKTILKWLIGVGGLSALAFSDLLSDVYLLVGGFWTVLIMILYCGFLVVLMSVNIEYIFTKSLDQSNEEKVDDKMGQTGVAKYDLSVDTMEIGLRDVLIQLAKGDVSRKVVFVLDELDKLDGDYDESRIEIGMIYKVVKPLKNLFTLSDAIFVFVVGDDFYRGVENMKTSKPYSGIHTLFTDRVFLSPLYYRDVAAVIDSFKDGEVIEGGTETYEKFKYFIGWKAKNHIFDTHELVENYTEYNQDGKLLHIYSGDLYHRGNLPEDWKLASSIQVYIAATYDEKMSPGESVGNEILYLTLREVGELLYKSGVIQVAKNERNYINILSNEVQDRIGVSQSKVSTEIRKDLSGAIENLLLRMENADGYEIVESVVEKVTEKNDQGEEISSNEIIRYVLHDDKTFPDLEIIRQKTKRTSYESQFMKEFEVLEKARFEILYKKLKAFDQYEPEFKRYSALAGKIRSETPRFERRSQIENNTVRIGYILDNVYSPTIHELLVNVAQSYGAAKHDFINTPGNPGVPMWDYDPNLSKLFHHIEDNYNYDDTFVVLSKDKKSVLVTIDLDKSDQDIYVSIPRKLRNSAVSKVINIVSSDNHDNVKGIWKIHKISRDLRGLGSLENEIANRLF